MFGDVGWGEILVLAVLALFIFGPEKLPRAAAEAGRALRQLRRMALSAKSDLESGLGPEMREFDIADLNPRRFVRKHLFEDEDPRPGTARTARTARTQPRRATATVDGDRTTDRDDGLADTVRPPYDTDAT